MDMTAHSIQINLDAVRQAAVRIRGIAHRTPVMTCASLDEMAGARLFFKCENFQKVGAFKFRGACNAVMKLSEAEAARGVLTHSSGNHAQAIALAARMRGVPAHIVMPTSATAVKRQAVEGYGARVVPCVPTLEARETTAAAVEAETGATFIHAYNHPDIIAGQGTAALELLEEVPDLDAIIAPIGGGGLMSGVCVASRGISPTIRIIGAEPSGADDAARSMAAGALIPQTGPVTIADGLLTSMGDLTWPIIRDQVDHIETLSEEAIVSAMRTTWERAKLLIEPSSAVAVAAAMSAAISKANRVGVILSGGNVDLEKLPWLDPDRG